MLKRTVAVATVAALGLGLAPVPTPATAATTGADPTIGLLRLQGDFSSASKSSAYGYVILNAWEHDLVPKIKANNPNAKVLVYKNMAATVDYATTGGSDNEFLPAGVGYVYADQNHPEWFLKDTNGNRVEFCSYKGAWLMDVGDPDYQSKWLANVAADLEGYGWDGVMIDDTLASPWAHLCGRKLAKYPKDADFAAATGSFLARVDALTSKGFLVVPNISDADLALWKKWVGYSSGALREWWTKAGTDSGQGYFTDHHWDFQMDQFEATEAAGKAFIGVTYSGMDDTRAMRYARASFLLGWKGGPSALVFHPGRGIDSWSEEWTVGIGTPRGERVKVGSAWRRDFTEGVALVNPSSSERATVDLGDAYLTPEGDSVTSVTLEPATGLVLQSAATAPQPDPEPTASPGPAPEESGPESGAGEAGVETPALDHPIRLRAMGPWGKRIVLRWRGTGGKRVVVYRNGRVIARRWGRGRLVDRVHRRRAPWGLYRVCVVGANRCSATVRPRRR